MQRKTAVIAALLLGIFVFAVNKAASVMSWYWIMWWFDMPMHFLGGMFCALIMMIAWYKPLWRLIQQGRYFRAFLFILIGTFVLGVVWEVYEHMLEQRFSGLKITSPLDTLSDLSFDVAGGLSAILIMYLPRKKKAGRDAILTQ